MRTQTKEADLSSGARGPLPDLGRRRPPRLLAFSALALGTFLTMGQASAETYYVVDAFKLEARSGPSTSHKIVKILESGAAVEVLGARDGYSRIQLEDGTTAFMLTRYLTTEPSARSRLEQALLDLSAEQAKSESLSTALNNQKDAAGRSEVERDQLRDERDALATELDELKRTASSAVEIREQNQSLQQQVTDLERELESTRAKNRALSDTSHQSWFIAGGGVLFAGMLMGLIIPKIRWQRRRGWNEL